MSYDIGILSLDSKISNREASDLYIALCEGDTSGVVPSQKIDAFYKELTAKHPEIDDVPEEEIDNTDLCPWSIAFDCSPGHLIISCVWPKADYVTDLLADLAEKHELAFFSSAAEVIIFPDGTEGKEKPWWKFW
ncbi:hypothetical protein [Microbulbifer sp. SSSA005]|uniref:hypothetical protein n=1 Tax=Microbulbifer sp. SSSA005 TaxID=3243378 RepID=UPI004039FB33